MSHMNERFIRIGGGGPWWSIGNHGQIVLVAIYGTFTQISNKLRPIWYNLRTTDFYVLGLQKREKMWSPL